MTAVPNAAVSPIRRRLGVYGGSFDPIHEGHLAPVEEARRSLGLDEILFVPGARVPHKPSGPGASAFHRFAMVALAIRPYPSFLLSDFEVARGGSTYTVDTLAHFAAEDRTTEVVLVIGSDSLASFGTWRAWREIVARHRVAVVRRDPWDLEAVRREAPPELLGLLAPPGAPLSDVPEGAAAPRIYWADNAPVTISSTWIRDEVRKDGMLAGKLPPDVEAYVRRHRLYRD